MSSSGRPRIGFLGVGKMGAPMARRLLEAGYDVTVHDVQAEAVAVLCRAGSASAASPAETASRTDVI